MYSALPLVTCLSMGDSLPAFVSSLSNEAIGDLSSIELRITNDMM